MARRGKSGTSLDKFLKPAVKKRKKQLLHVFAQLYKPRVDERLIPLLPIPLPESATAEEKRKRKSEALSIRNKLIMDMWREVVSGDCEVYRAVQKEKARLDGEASLVDDEGNEPVIDSGMTGNIVGLDRTRIPGELSRSEKQK